MPKDNPERKPPSPRSSRKKTAPRKGARGSLTEEEIKALSTVYLSKADLRRHIHEGLRPYQHLAEQAGLPFLAYLIGMAVEESGSEPEKK